ncbi:hypothetical protein LBMAG42_02090 [Deltaproteobacteria bacterium]|nr:hypothetical protein LBMAG42_02090 [Deltaproteobacteria bacterium]
MRVVLIDTATGVVGVAAYAEGVCVFAETQRIQAGADAWLTPALARALTTLGSLDAVAVVTGPGAFTGLRVGIAHALGLALARVLPVIAVPTLALRAAAAPGHPRVLALLDARKGRLYAQTFDTTGETPRALGEPADIAPAALDLADVVVVGEGVGAAGAALVNAKLLSLADDAHLRAAALLLHTLPLLDPGAVAPFYLRAPDAQPPNLVQ